jgi:uncharacterized membrane protein YeaQ/YmgE (transglycosylase-associated protein family)
MTLPSILLGIILSSLLGVLFHLWRGGGFDRLILYIVMGWIGFWVGQWLAEIMDWNFLTIGQLHIGLATLSSIVFLMAGYWLSLVPKKIEGTK